MGDPGPVRGVRLVLAQKVSGIRLEEKNRTQREFQVRHRVEQSEQRPKVHPAWESNPGLTHPPLAMWGVSCCPSFWEAHSPVYVYTRLARL